MWILQNWHFRVHWTFDLFKLLNVGVHVWWAINNLTFLGPTNHCKKEKQRPQLKFHCCAFNFYSIQDDAFAFANQVGYPCLLRPSYVLRWDLVPALRTCSTCKHHCRDEPPTFTFKSKYGLFHFLWQLLRLILKWPVLCFVFFYFFLFLVCSDICVQQMS